MWFHRHKWVTVSVDYIPPRRFTAEGIARTTAEALICGQSIIHLQCNKCGDITEKRVLGRICIPYGARKWSVTADGKILTDPMDAGEPEKTK